MPPSSRDSRSANEAFAAAAAMCRRQARGFYFANAFLPKEKRDAACALHTFCGMIRDALKTERAVAFSENSFELLRERLNDIYENHLEMPNPEFRSQEQHALQAIQLTVQRYQIPQQYFLDFAEGFRMDAGISRYATWSSLEKYCYHASGSFCLMLSCILGLTHSDAKKYAIQLGAALQLTRILRDVRLDQERGKIYLPLADMIAFKYTERELAAGIVNDNFRELMKFQIARARKLFRDGAEGIGWLGGDGSRLSASLLVVIRAGILDAIERQKYDVFSRRACLTLSQTAARFPRAWKLARRNADEPLPNVF